MVRPTSTYRVQVRPSFDLFATAELAGYLADLGVTHLYSAPLLTAVPGSEHGYDVVDHSAVNPSLGGEEGRLRLASALREHGLGLVVDIVPNHMGVAVPAANPAWWDVLAKGRASAYAHWFDIDWTRERLLIPVLGSSDTADLSIVDGELRYFEHRFPIAAGTLGGSPQEVHERQHYELVSWRRANEELNYRRFFAIDSLAGLRVEDPSVFEATHREVLRWVGAGDVDGIRVDHPDGLRDPGGYLRRLRSAAPSQWLVVEKILAVGEAVDPSWPVEGTTGYDALREICGLFVDPSAEGAFAALHPEDWTSAAYAEKRRIADALFGAELRRLARLASSVADARAALVEVAAAFDVYRTYLPLGATHLHDALRIARTNHPALAGAIDALAPRLADPDDELALRFQQLTGAVMAKGVEDTASYRWTRFVALNEVGGEPDRFGVPVKEFHAAAADRAPFTMTTLSTHDTKRGEDVRARLAVLSEIPTAWTAALSRWRPSSVELGDPSFELLLWQTVVGTWPIESHRLKAYLVKAAREADRSTSWTDPDTGFEERLAEVVDRLYGPLRADLDRFVAGITAAGWSNSLGQKLVQLLSPGIPDTYQGTELWENSLVDPDNRRPVDFEVRRALLRRLDEGWLPPVDDTGAAKLLVVSRALRVRRDRPLERYRPVTATGPASEHVVAFDRGGVVAVATRLPLRLTAAGGWRDTALDLPPGAWTDVLTGRAVSDRRLAAVLATYPVALLVATDA